MKIDYVKHKRRFDRGGVYAGYYQNIGMTLLLVAAFKINAWWIYVTAGLIVFGGRYLLGYWDEIKVLDKEQSQYTQQNSIMMDMKKKIDDIHKMLNEL